MSRTPFNVKIMDLTPIKIGLLKPVTSLDITDGATREFHPDGLFSTDIFGRVGEARRDTAFSFINLKTTILHPLIFKQTLRLKQTYRNICLGTDIVEWDPEEGDFVPASPFTGDTGFNFFLKHWSDIQFRRNRSTIRNLRIDFIERNRNVAFTDKVLVLPAGLRDVDVDVEGRLTLPEINNKYRRLIAVTNNIALDSNVADTPSLSNTRFMLQRSFMDIYAEIETMLKGKHGFLQSKWGSRKVFYGTANVITSIVPIVGDLDAPNNIRGTDTVVGLYQHIKAIEPVTIGLLQRGYLNQAINSDTGNATLTNTKTLKREYVELSNTTIDRWLSEEGLIKVINKLSKNEAGHLPVIIEDRYLALVYRGPSKTAEGVFNGEPGFYIFNDIDELPEGVDRKLVSALTYTELIYLSGYRQWDTFPNTTTRYPAIQIDSIVPGTTHVKTTETGEVRYELDGNLEVIDSKNNLAIEYPRLDVSEFFNSLGPHPTRLKGQGGDFDGDRENYIVAMTDEARAEIYREFTKRSTHVTPDGKMRASVSIDPINFFLANTTGE